jgi:tetratricopeptide (TPR) repeat protein
MKRIVQVLLFMFLAGFAWPAVTAQTLMTEADEIELKVVNLYRQGNLKEALPLAKKLVELRSASLGTNRPALVEALYKLAIIYSDLAQLKTALPLFMKALETNEAALPGDPSSTRILDQIAQIHHRQGDERLAIEWYKRSLAIREKSSGKQHRDVIRSVLTLALLSTSIRDDEAAEKLFKRFDESKSTLSDEDQSQCEREMGEFACQLRTHGNPAGADKIEAKLSIVGVAERVDVGGKTDTPGTINGSAIHLSIPHYPQHARALKIEDNIEVRAIINESGEVISACALGKGDLGLRVQSQQAALSSRFTPTFRNGKAVKVVSIIFYHFRVSIW